MRNREVLTLLIILIVGAVLRGYNIGEGWLPLFIDESTMLLNAKDNFSYFMRENLSLVMIIRKFASQSIIYTIPFFLSPKILENPEIAIIVFRSISFFASTLSIVMIWLISRRVFSFNLSILTVTIFALFPLNVFYGRLALLYPLLHLFQLINIYFCLKVLETRSSSWLVISLLFSIYLFFTYPFSWLINIPIILLLIMLAISGELNRNRELLLTFILSCSLLVICLFTVFSDVPRHYQHLFQKWAQPESGWFIGPFGWSNLEKITFSLNYIFYYLNLYTMGYLTFILALVIMIFVSLLKEMLKKARNVTFIKIFRIKLCIKNFTKGLYSKNSINPPTSSRSVKFFILVCSFSSLLSLYYGFYARRVVFITTLLAFIFPLSIEVFRKLFKKCKFFERIILSILIVQLIMMFFVNYHLISNVIDAPLFEVDKQIFIHRYTSGYGFKEVTLFIKEKIINDRDVKVLFITDAPNLLRFYLSDRYNVIGIDENNFQGFIRSVRMNFSGEIYLVVKKSYVNEWVSKLIEKGYIIEIIQEFRVPLAEVDNCIIIYKLH
ncbi:MAG: glycosyltransferase family 39 protein [Nitrososphaeria archaeon]